MTRAPSAVQAPAGVLLIEDDAALRATLREALQLEGYRVWAAASLADARALWAHNHRVAPEDVAGALGITAEQVGRVYKDIEAKRRATRYLHAGPLLVEPVAEIDKLG